MERKFEATRISKATKVVKEVKVVRVRNYNMVSAVKAALGITDRQVVVSYINDGFKLDRFNYPDYWIVKELIPDAISNPRYNK